MPHFVKLLLIVVGIPAGVILALVVLGIVFDFLGLFDRLYTRSDR